MNTRLASLSLACLLLLAGACFAQSRTGISDSVRRQIASINEMKRTFTAAERKMSSSLVFKSRAAAGQSIGAAASFTDTSAKASTLIAVDIGGRISDELRAKIEANGGKVESAATRYGIMRASLPLRAIPVVAAYPDVKWIREAGKGRTNVGALTSQAFVSHTANQVAPITGAGVKVGVMSDSATPARVSALIASGDLGATTTVLSGQDGSGVDGHEDEGTAMMEIVQDIAPGAQLFFATAGNGVAQFASNIDALAVAGCKIIVDDYTYFDEGAFQDGPIAQAVNAFVAGGGLYFSSAANSGNLTSATSGTWEGDFLDGGPSGTPIPTGGVLHDFGTAGSPQAYDVVTLPSEFITLKWSDPLGASSNDYDLYILDSTGTTIKESSITWQDGTQDPYEFVDYVAAANDRIVVMQSPGAAARALRVDTNRGVLSIGTVGSTFGHNAGANTQCMAAVYWNSAKNGTQPFSSLDKIETFSSDGPRKIFFHPDGSPITPGNFLFATDGGATLQKPDFAAADGVETKTPGFLPFFGTSAAAPHAAGIAALVKSAKPALTAAQVRTILSNTAIDIMAAGIDRDSGVGVLMAKPAVQAALAP